MNNDEYLLSMKQAIDDSVKDDEGIQELLSWLYTKTALLNTHYQKSALRAFYYDVVEGTQSVNREISQMLDSRIDKDIDEVREIANQSIALQRYSFFEESKDFLTASRSEQIEGLRADL